MPDYKNKELLKFFFKAGKRPKEAHFHSLIDSTLNLNNVDSFGVPLGGAQVLTGSLVLSSSGNTSLNVEGAITASGGISMSGTLFASKIIATQVTSSFVTSSKSLIVLNYTSSGDSIFGNDATDTHIFTGHITASHNISASGNITSSGAYIKGNISGSGTLTIGGATTLKGDTTIPKTVKLYLGDSSGLHVYSEGTATDENQIILAKTNNLRILNQAHGKDIIFGTENASGTAKTPLTLKGDGSAVFGGGISASGLPALFGAITSSGNISASGNLIGVSASLDYIKTTGNISASGTTTLNNLTVHGTQFTNRIDRVDNSKIGVQFADGIHVSSGAHITASGNISASGDLIIGGNISSSGNITKIGSISSSGVIYTTDNITGSNLLLGTGGSTANIINEGA